MKKTREVGMLCTIGRETFHSFTKNTWISVFGTLCHITNKDTGLYNLTKINKMVEGSSSTMSTTKKENLYVKVC